MAILGSPRSTAAGSVVTSRPGENDIQLGILRKK